MPAAKGQKQHVDPHRKESIRADLLRFALSGPAYVPFIGDGDLAAKLYGGRHIDGADIDPVRIATAAARLPDADIRQADCERAFPFADRSTDAAPYAIADFDAYVHPYQSFKAWWTQAPHAERVICFFTDGHRQAIKRSRIWIDPDGQKHEVTGPEARHLYNFYWTAHIEPWLAKTVAPATIIRTVQYLRSDMLYFGAVIDAPGYEGVRVPGGYYSTGKRGKFDALKQETYLELLAQGESRGTAARKVGVSMTAISEFARAHATFANAQSLSEMEAVGEIENSLYTAAKSGNVTAQQVYLYNRAPDRWADKRNTQVALTGPDGTGPAEVRVEYTHHSDARAAGLAAALVARLAVIDVDGERLPASEDEPRLLRAPDE